MQILCTMCRFCDFALLSSSCLWILIRDPVGLNLGSLWTPESGYVGSNSAPNCLQERSKRLQENAQRLPRGPKRLQEALQTAFKRPPGCQDASKSSTRGSRNGFGMVWGTIWNILFRCLTAMPARWLLAVSRMGAGGMGPPYPLPCTAQKKKSIYRLI